MGHQSTQTLMCVFVVEVGGWFGVWIEGHAHWETVLKTLTNANTQRPNITIHISNTHTAMRDTRREQKRAMGGMRENMQVGILSLCKVGYNLSL